ncbi:hypothetical protein OKA06_06050 [Novosphingobium sp. MW5]|nr:hypothetical protein [Novosphingobium sp. MW5]
MTRLGAAILVASACAYASDAQAAPGQADYQTRARVEAQCSITTQIPPMTLTATIDKNGKLDPSLVNTSFRIDGMICTAPSQIVISATSLRLTRPQLVLPAGQSQTINFIAKATGWSANPATVTTRDTSPIGSLEVYAGVPQVQYNARSGGITINVQNFAVVTEKAPNGNGAPAKPVSGNYAATITISLTPKN